MGIDQYLAGGILQNLLSMRNLSMGCWDDWDDWGRKWNGVDMTDICCEKGE